MLYRTSASPSSRSQPEEVRGKQRGHTQMSVSPLCCVSSSSLMFPLSPLTSVMTERTRLCPLDHCGTPVAASLCPGSADSFVNVFSWVGLFQVNYKPCDQLQRHKEVLHECHDQFPAGTDCAHLCCWLPHTYSIDVVADHTYTPSRKFFYIWSLFRSRSGPRLFQQRSYRRSNPESDAS